jgi:predicted nucleotidyltransferase
MKHTIDMHLKTISSLCKKYKVKKLFAFGSVLTDRFNDNSDIDLLVDFDKERIEDYFDNFFDFKYSLEDVFNRKIDLLEDQTVKNPYLRKSIDETKTLIYG